MSEVDIPLIDVTALFGPAGAARDEVDAAIMRAASGSGFMTVTARPELIPATAAERARLLRVFGLPETQTRRLWRRKFAEENPNVYRGWFPVQQDQPSFKRGIDMGPDIAGAVASGNDPLREPTPLPPEDVLPGWRADAASYYRAMERLGGVMMRAIARGLGLPGTQFDAAFVDGISTLRLIHYPVPQERPGTERRLLLGAAHVDSGFVTLLAQDGVEGLQAQNAAGDWIDVPPAEGALAVNFGAVLESWTGGRIRATRHRVMGPGRDRYSIPFFYEPAVDAVIAPLPGGAGFAPFSYGDHLWAKMTAFTEFQGLEGLRSPRGGVVAA